VRLASSSHESTISSCLGSQTTSTSFASSVHARLECLETVDRYWIDPVTDEDFCYLDLLKLFCQTASSEEQILCSTLLLSNRNGPTTVSREIFDRLRNDDILEMLSTASNSKNERVAPVAMRYLWRFVDVILSGLHPIGSRGNVAYSQDEVRSMLCPLLESDQTPLPTTVATMGLCERWISDLEVMGSIAPEAILASQIIEYLTGLKPGDRVGFWKWTSNEPLSPQAGGAEMNTRLWNLCHACRKALQAHNSCVDPPENQS
jgi:hypothetical protein